MLHGSSSVSQLQYRSSGICTTESNYESIKTMFQLRAVYLFLACAVFALLLSGGDAAPRPQEEAGGAAADLEAGVEAEEKDLQGAASIGYGYYSSPYLGGYYGSGFYGGGYWPHYSGSYYGLGEYGEWSVNQ